MKLWRAWMKCVWQLKTCCSRNRTFLWMVVFLMAVTVRCGDIVGMSAVIRALGLEPYCYDRLLDFIHSPSLCVLKLTHLWVQSVLKIFPTLMLVNGKYVLLGDGIKIAKEGKKMPAVKKLHQESESNSKAEYIMGHSCQAVSILVGAFSSFFAVPLASRIHEGVVFSNRDKKTLLDKMIILLQSLGLGHNYYFVADAYYATKKIIKGMLNEGNHLISRVKSNAVAYYPAEKSETTSRGRPKKYGKKIKLKSLFKDMSSFTSIMSPVYGDNCKIQYRSIDLLCRSVGIIVRYVAVKHPSRGRIILISTDLTLSAKEVIKLYGLRFKIEVSFKTSVRGLGAYAYRFWMKKMEPIKRNSGNQYMHRKSEDYRKAIKRKLDAYHRHTQLVLIAQGLLQFISITMSDTVWKKFGSWIRTIRPGIAPSEMVTAMAMKNSLPEFFADKDSDSNCKKFIIERMDFTRVEGQRLAA